MSHETLVLIATPFPCRNFGGARTAASEWEEGGWRAMLPKSDSVFDQS